MGKKSKSKPSKELPTVSIVTVTQYKRRDTLSLLVEHIKAQEYSKIIQWVIVEGSSSTQDRDLNKSLIESLSLIENKSLNEIKIDYIVPPLGTMLGELRNIGNNRCEGDITVVMDDDDYYPPSRVSHAVKRLMESNCLIAGCSDKYLYDYCLQVLYRCMKFGDFHSTNDCMAWKKEYLLENKHDPTKSNAEESSFTKEFKNPMVQLDAEKVHIGSSHRFNTFNKKFMCVLGSIKCYPTLNVVGDPITKYIPKKVLKRYEEIFKNDKVSEYDIVYMCGGTSIDWDPRNQSLGGSEQAVVHLASEWVKMGKKVAVYGKVPQVTVNGVSYFDWGTFDYSAQHNVVILWRRSGANCFLQFPVKYKKLFADYHDNIWDFRFDYEKYMHKIDKIFFKSKFHLESYEKHYKLKLPSESYSIIPNGIRTIDFQENPGVVRSPFRFCYCSSYDRGLVEILQYIWPIIFRNLPEAELHVYYGMEQVQDQNFVKFMTMLLGQPGVMDHGRRPMKDIIREKWTSTYHIYITDCEAEIDCISVRESLCTGCIPLLSNSGVFADRDGVHFDLGQKTQEDYKNIAVRLLNIVRMPSFADVCKAQFKNSQTIVGWDKVAQEWVSFFN